MYTYASESVLGLELLGKVQSVVDETEAGALAAAELAAETEDEDGVGSGLVHRRQLFANFGLWDRRAVGMEDVDDLEKANNQTWQLPFFQYSLLGLLYCIDGKRHKWHRYLFLEENSIIKAKQTICLRASRRLVMSFRVRMVTTESLWNQRMLYKSTQC